MIKATQNRVIIKKTVISEQVRNGLIIPNDHGTPCTAVIVAVGPGKMDNQGVYQPIEVKPGDRVIYNRHAGQPVNIDGEELLVVYDHDIFAVIE